MQAAVVVLVIHMCRFAFKGVSFPPPTSLLGIPLGYGLTARLKVNNLGLTPVQPLMNNKLPNIKIDGGTHMRVLWHKHAGLPLLPSRRAQLGWRRRVITPIMCVQVYGARDGPNRTP